MGDFNVLLQRCSLYHLVLVQQITLISMLLLQKLTVSDTAATLRIVLIQLPHFFVEISVCIKLMELLPMKQGQKYDLKHPL